MWPFARNVHDVTCTTTGHDVFSAESRHDDFPRDLGRPSLRRALFQKRIKRRRHARTTAIVSYAVSKNHAKKKIIVISRRTCIESDTTRIRHGSNTRRRGAYGSNSRGRSGRRRRRSLWIVKIASCTLEARPDGFFFTRYLIIIIIISFLQGTAADTSRHAVGRYLDKDAAVTVTSFVHARRCNISRRRRVRRGGRGEFNFELAFFTRAAAVAILAGRCFICSCIEIRTTILHTHARNIILLLCRRRYRCFYYY